MVVFRGYLYDKIQKKREKKGVQPLESSLPIPPKPPEKPKENKGRSKLLTTSRWQGFFQTLFILSIVALYLLIYYYAGNFNEVILPILLLGGFFFLPIGAFVGWIFVDPFQRAKIYRSVRKKNYGIVNFVSKGQRIVSRIKNFDEDLLFVRDAVWHLEPNRVFTMTKEDTDAEISAQYPISPENIATVQGIPTLFLDMNTMRPLTFWKDQGEADPIDLGSTLKGYLMNQLQKNLFFKRTMQMSLILTIVMCFVATWFAYQNNMLLNEDIPQKLDKMQGQIDNIAKRLGVGTNEPQKTATTEPTGGQQEIIQGET